MALKGPTMARLGGKTYTVFDFPKKSIDNIDPTMLKKGIAYRYSRQLQIGESVLTENWLLPYHGLTDDKFSYNSAKIGMWLRKINHSQYKLIIIRPRTIKEATEYRIGQEKDIVAATLNHEYQEDQFADNSLNLADIGTDVYRPPIRVSDDPLNMIMKLAIRLKCAPFEPYGKRLEALAVDKTKGIEGANIRNNTRRAIRLNTALSPAKFMQYGDVWQVESAIILRDLPSAMHKMGIPEGKMLIIYPNGIPFEINDDDLIDVSDLISEAIAESTSEEQEQGSKKDKKEVVENENNN